MYDKTEKMDFNELKREVLALKQEIAIMKREYADILSNLDVGNFTSQFISRNGLK